VAPHAAQFCAVRDAPQLEQNFPLAAEPQRGQVAFDTGDSSDCTGLNIGRGRPI